MPKTFFFYDLETSGLNPREDRIMQFAGQRTDMELKPIGEPVNILVKMTDDILPSPEALMVTMITPQQTVSDGYSEAEFAKILMSEIFTPDTIVVGFNNVRFDDEFIRYLFWRNFYDPYEWAYKDGRSRWDLLDVIRMTRALRPENIKWPVDEKGDPSNRLELITKLNGVDHQKAHDALSDVLATISVAQLIRDKQPQLFGYLLKMRDKNELKKLINLETKQPFVYTSGKYDKDFNKTTIAFPLTAGRNGSIVVYDLRYDPAPFLHMKPKDLTAKIYASWDDRRSEEFIKIPIKELNYGRTPAVAPISVLSQGDGWEKIKLDADIIKQRQSILLSAPEFAENIRTAIEDRAEYEKSTDCEARLYESFLPPVDKMRVEQVQKSNSTELADFHPNFVDERLPELLLHYKARNFPNSLAEDEVALWEKWRSSHLMARLPNFTNSLQKLLHTTTDENKMFVLLELHLWAESTMPSDL